MFHPFVIPFSIGFSAMGVILVVRYALWVKGLSVDNRNIVFRNVFSKATFSALAEIFREAVLHLKIYKANPVLGFMHMSLALGWFLLIVGGKLETWHQTGNFINPVRYAIFFRFFEPVLENTIMNGTLALFMEISLLLVLTGLSLAFVKRIHKRVMGLKNTTKHTFPNRVALFFLWMIFPIRLLAESSTVAVYGGGAFLTSSVANVFVNHNIASVLQLPLWWAYSSSLGLFFLALPFSRYFHIPTEMGLILLKKWGVKNNEKFSPNSGLQAFEVHSCSSCGVCLDACPAVNIVDSKFQAAYFVNKVRSGKDYELFTSECLSCGSCKNACPVGINLEELRLSARSAMYSDSKFDYSYLPSKMILWRESHQVALYTGCMGRLNPKTTIAFKELLNEANIDFVHIDENDSVCCGRPLQLAGKLDMAQDLIRKNKEYILDRNPQILVTTCPICYRFFNENYNLNIQVMHHTQYLSMLLEDGKIKREKSDINFVYHDPCELGRGSICYNEPRHVINSAGNLLPSGRQMDKSLCCGNNLGSISLSESSKNKITANTLSVLSENNPDCIVTSCPMCKQAFAKQSSVAVKDIAEVLRDAKKNVNNKSNANKTSKELSEMVI